MLYPVIVHKEEGSDYGVIVPDFPGLFSGGQTLEGSLANVQDAIETYYDGEEDVELPSPSRLEDVVSSEDSAGGGVVLVDMDFSFLDKKTVPVNITMPAYMRNRVDRAAREQGLNRSQFLLQAAQRYIDVAHA